MMSSGIDIVSQPPQNLLSQLAHLLSTFEKDVAI